MTWKSDFLEVQAEAGGAWRVYVIRPSDALAVLGAMLSGDPEAGRLMSTIARAGNIITSAPRRRPMLCGCCPEPLRGIGFAIGVVVPERDAPSTALTFALCPACSVTAARAEASAWTAMRRFWPDARPIVISDPVGGRA